MENNDLEFRMKIPDGDREIKNLSILVEIFKNRLWTTEERMRILNYLLDRFGEKEGD